MASGGVVLTKAKYAALLEKIHDLESRCDEAEKRCETLQANTTNFAPPDSGASVAVLEKEEDFAIQHGTVKRAVSALCPSTTSALSPRASRTSSRSSNTAILRGRHVSKTSQRITEPDFTAQRMTEPDLKAVACTQSSPASPSPAMSPRQSMATGEGDTIDTTDAISFRTRPSKRVSHDFVKLLSRWSEPAESSHTRPQNPPCLPRAREKQLNAVHSCIETSTGRSTIQCP